MSHEPTKSGYSPAQLSAEDVERLLQSPSGGSIVPVYLDLLCNQPKNEQTRSEFREILTNKFNIRLPDAAERLWELPPLILHRPTDEYINLLVEARELFTMGYFYSCVAMCGIVGEKLVKDVLRGATLVSIDGSTERPTEEAFDQLEHVEVSGIVKFLNKSKLLNDEARKAAEELIRLRNQYAHARGKSPQNDALQSINKLHILVEGTVSVFKSYEIVEGKFVPRTATSELA